MSATPTEVIPAHERAAILNRAVATYVKHGYTAQLNDGRRAVVSRRQQLNIPLNALLVVFTGGFWLLLLAIRLLNWPTDRVVLTVDETGLLIPEFLS